MAVLLVAEHDNETLNDATAKALTAACALGTITARCTFWSPVTTAVPRPTRRPGSKAQARCSSPMRLSLRIISPRTWPR